MGNQRCLNFAYGHPINPGGCELRTEQIKVLQALRAVDQICIRYGVGCARKKIRQPHLVPNAKRQYIQCEVKRTGNLLENVVQEFVFNGRSAQRRKAKEKLK